MKLMSKSELTDRCNRGDVWQFQRINLDLQVRRIHHEFDLMLVLILVHVHRILSIYTFKYQSLDKPILSIVFLTPFCVVHRHLQRSYRI